MWSVCGVYVECVWSVYVVCMECVGRSFPSHTPGTWCTLRALMAATVRVQRLASAESGAPAPLFQVFHARDVLFIPAPGSDPLSMHSQFLLPHAFCL